MIFGTAIVYGSSLALLTLLHGCYKWQMIASPYNTMNHANKFLTYNWIIPYQRAFMISMNYGIDQKLGTMRANLFNAQQFME